MLKRKITTLKNAFSRGNTKSTNVHTKSHHSISGIQETGCGHSDCKCNGKCKVCKCHPETTESGNVVGKSVQDSGEIGRAHV